MTHSDGFQNGSLVKLALGFVVGLGVIPFLILLLSPSADEVSDAAYFQAPREARYALLSEVAASNRYDERVLIGSSIVTQGFESPQGGNTAQFGLSYMGVEETTELVRLLLNRSRPPETIIVDWSALHGAPPEYFGVSRTPNFFSLDNLVFSVGFRYLNEPDPSRRGNATWRQPDRELKFKRGQIDQFLKRVALFESYTRVNDFVDDLNEICVGNSTRFVIVRFPIFLDGHINDVRDFLRSNGTTDYSESLNSVSCTVEFVDFLAESVGEKGIPRDYLTDENKWRDFYHFRPSVGEVLLRDPRVSNAENAVRTR